MQILSKVNKESAFKTWQKNSFRPKFLSSLRKNLLFSSEVETARECLQAWRRFASFNKGKSFHHNEITLLREYNTKSQIFSTWFNSAMQRAPLSLFCSKLDKAKKRINLRVGFQKVLEMAVQDEELDSIKVRFDAMQDHRMTCRAI